MDEQPNVSGCILFEGGRMVAGCLDGGNWYNVDLRL